MVSHRQLYKSLITTFAVITNINRKTNKSIPKNNNLVEVTIALLKAMQLDLYLILFIHVLQELFIRNCQFSYF